MKTNLTISRSTDVEKTYPICNDGDIFISKDVLTGYVANTLFICDSYSDNKDPEFSAITLYKVSDGTITEFGIINDPQVEELIAELNSILDQFNVFIKLIYKGKTSSLYQVTRINKTRD